METAGKLLDEDDFVEAMKERGLGTPATRAATIEKLLRAGKSGAYMERQGNNLIPTQKGIQIVIRLAQTLPELISPVLTGEWEHKLLQMEKGKVSRVAFMREIVEFVEDLAQSQPEDVETEVSLPCPVCGGAMVENGKVIHHKDETGCGFRLWKTIAGKALPEAVIRQLMENGRSGVIEGFVGKTGKKFAAELQINVRDAKVDFVFGGNANAISLDGLACPSCKASELTSSGSKISCKCGFSMWATVAGAALSNEQLRVLFETGTSEVLSFVSKKGENFSAKLKLDSKTGKTEFVFDNDKRNGAGTESKEGDTCPTCKKGKLLFKQNSQGKHFLGCSKYPDCRHFEWGHNK
jgi:DNA topoisomerase-3